MSDAPRTISVLVADDDEDQLVLVDRLLRSDPDVDHVVTSVPDGRAALTVLNEEVFDVALLDLSMPGLDGLEVMEAVAGDAARPEVVFVSGRGTVASATQAMKLGAFDFVEKPVERERLLTVVWKASEARRVRARSERLGAAARRRGSAEILTQDPGMRKVVRLMERVAPSDVSVLIVGESGTGKELVARGLHRLSGREDEPMVALNCAAVSEALAESELFGHEKGSFTGASGQKMGLVEMADGGTLFLDEIGEMELPLQAKLLRTLEAKRFRRVGGVKELPANFRLISATNRGLGAAVADGSFRQDLLYRINAVVLELPPLRERRGDIALLARHFLADCRPANGPEQVFSGEALQELTAYGWPGNIRELRNVVERAALLAPDPVIGVADLGPLGYEAAVRPRSGAEEANGLPSLDLARLEAMAVERALERTGWHQGDAAELLGVSPRTLHRKIRALGLRRPDGASA